MRLFKRKNRGKNEESPRTLRRGLALLLCAALMLSMLPVSALAAEGKGAVSSGKREPAVSMKDDKVSFDEDVLARLRAGELSKAEIDALIEQGLTLEDLQDPYAIMPLAITTEMNDVVGEGIVDRKWFAFRVDKPDETQTFYTFEDFTATYSYVDKDWQGPHIKEQVYPNDEEAGTNESMYYQAFNDDDPETKGKYERSDLKGTYQYYPHLNGTVNGIEYKVARVSYHDTTVKRIGNVVIDSMDGQLRYVYVSSERTTGSTSHFIVPTNPDGSIDNHNKIMVEYDPLEYGVTYEVYVDYLDGQGGQKIENVDDPTFGVHTVFGSTRSQETVEQVVTATVAIPDGYYARVYIGDKSEAEKGDESTFPTHYISYAESTENGGDGVTSPYERFPTKAGYGQFPLGMGPSFKTVGDTGDGPAAVVLDENAKNTPGFFALSAVYTSGEKGSADADMVIRVIIGKRTNFTISNDLWGQTQTDRVKQQDKIKGNLLGGERTVFLKRDPDTGLFFFDDNRYNEIKPSTGQPYVKPTDVRINQRTGAFSFTWIFTTKTAEDGENYVLQTMSVNGESVDVPYVRTADPSGATEADKGKVAQSPTVNLRNASVRVLVEIVDTKGPDYQDDETDYGDQYQRRYTVTFSNVTRNIVITTSAMCPSDHKSFTVSSLDGVDLEMWNSGGKDWDTVNQGQVLHVDESSTFWSEFPGEEDLPVDVNGKQISGNFNVRAKPQYGYELPGTAVIHDDSSEGGSGSGTLDGTVDGITYVNSAGNVQKINDLAGPDADGWYYLDFSGDGNDSYTLSIFARLKQYQVKYLDGIETGKSMQEGVNGLPTLDSLRNFPDFSSWNGLTEGDYKITDNNSGRYYDLISNSSIRISANIPSDTAGRPALFKFWVLTDQFGEPINLEKIPHVGYDKTGGSDGENLNNLKGDSLRQLTDVAGGAYQNEATGIYTFYLTAYWTPAAEAFSYYIVFDNITETGNDKMDAYHPGNLYPIRNKGTGDPTGRYAATDRQAHAKVSSTTVVFDPDSSLVAEYMATQPWYQLYEGQEEGDKHKNGNRGLFVYSGVENRDIINVWYAYTLGGLKIESKVDNAKLDHNFTYEVSFKAPETDDPTTAGNETLFFDEGFRSYIDSIESSRRPDGGTSVSYEKSAAESSLTQVYSIGYQDQSGQSHTLPLEKQADGAYTGTFTLEGGQTATFDDLPAGTAYTVTEVEGTLGYSLGGSEKITESRTDDDTDPETDEFPNTAAVSGTIASLVDDVVIYNNELGLLLELQQSVGGGEPTDEDIFVGPGGEITYTVTAVNLSEKAITANITDTLPENLVYVNGSASNSGAYAGGTITWSNVSLQPTGAAGAGDTATFTFRATAKIDDAAQSATVSNQARAVSGTSRFFSNVVNAKYAPAGLTVTKTVGGKGGNTDASAEKFTFQIRLNDTNVNGTYGDLTFANGISTFALGSGESKHADNLPTGVGYTVEELRANLDGYTTTVTGGSATGTLGDEGVTVAFENKRPQGASTSLTGTVTLESDDKNLEADEFSFLILPNTDAGTASGRGPIPTSGRSVKNDGAGNIVFLTEEDKYYYPGTYTYSVRPDMPDTIPAGYSFDDTMYTVIVTVSLDEATDTASIVSVTISKVGGSSAEAILFEHGYDADVVTAMARATKRYNGVLHGNDFTLELEAEDPPTAPLPGGVTGSASTVNASGGQFTFSRFTFPETGTFVYKFSERDDGDPNIKYDDAEYYCEVVVTADGYKAAYYKGEDDYKAKRNPLTVTDVIFENILHSSLTVRNTIDGGGAAKENKDFTFTLTLKDTTVNQILLDASDYAKQYTDGGKSATLTDNGDGTCTATFTLKGGESFTFRGLPVNMRYEIAEAESGADGYVTTVTGNNASGVVAEDDSVTVEFVNRKPGATQVDTEKLTGSVTLSTDSLVDVKLQADQFEFVLLPYSNNPPNGPVRERTTVTNTADGKIPFYDLFSSDGFATAGTYRYTVRQTNGNAPGYQYDTAEYTVTVVVSDNGGDTLAKAISFSVRKDGVTGPTDAITFANVYAPIGATIDEFNTGSDNGLVVRKELTGGTLSDGLFYFMITADNSNPANGGPIGVDPETGGKRKTVTNAANGAIRLFAGGLFRKVGEYNYIISEMDRGTAGYTYDSRAYSVKVNVTNNPTSGRLEARVVSVNGTPNIHSITFQNSYYAPTTVREDSLSQGGPSNLVVETTLQGKNLAANQFRFAVAPVAGNPAGDPITGTRYVTNAANGSVKLFDGVTFGQPGEYKYTVSQYVASPETGYTYDRSVYTVTVKVETSLVNNVGRLVATVSITDANGSPVNSIVFENQYESNAVSVPEGDGGLQATKILEGADLAGGQFRFTVTPAAGNPAGDPITAVRTVSNNANGSIRLFNGVSYDTAGDYTYTVQEVNDGQTGYTYDSSVYTVTVSVTDNEGELSISTATKKGGADTGNRITFQNSYSYSASDATVTEGAGGLHVTKTLNGGTLSANQFSFTVTRDKDNPAGDPVTSVRTVKNARDGSIKLFDGVRFGTAGTYKYTVKEVNAGAKGYTYDENEYTVTVTVSDNGAGQLTAATSVSKAGAFIGNEITFVNSYTNPGGPVTPNPPAPPAPRCECPNCDPAECTCSGGCSDGKCECDGCKGGSVPDNCDGGATCPSRNFTDLNPSVWYHKATDYVITKKLMSGTSTTEFSPNATLTRAMLVTILWRSAGSPKSTLSANPFKDVPTNQYYYQAVMWAYENNVVAGTSTTTFTPNSPITREQLAAILWRYAGSPGTAGSFAGFSDSGKISSYAEIAMRWVLEHNIMSGKGNGILDPGGKSTRAEAASMLMRYLERDTDAK